MESSPLPNWGILFLNGLPQFPKNVLEALREPLQDGVVNISRVNSKIDIWLILCLLEL